MPRKKKDNYYVSNKSMNEEMLRFKESGVISEELGSMFIEVATNFANKGSFSGYTWKRDMIGEAVFTCVRYAHNFDPEKGDGTPNPFAYFTQIIYHSFLNYIKKQKKHSEIKDTCYNNMFMLEEDRYTEKSIDYELLK